MRSATLLPALLLPAGLLITPSPAAAASRFGAIMEGPVGAWLLFGAIIVALVLISAFCREAATYLSERTHSSRVARLMDVLASQADGIVGLLLSHPPAPSDTLRLVREAAIAQSIAYVQLNLPATVKAIGASDGVLATRLGTMVAARMRDGVGAAAAVTGDDPAGDLTRVVLSAVLPQPAATPAG